jgi:hypothetical protein
MPEMIFKPTGRVKAAYSEGDIGDEKKELIGELEIFPEFEAALENSSTRALLAVGKVNYDDYTILIIFHFTHTDLEEPN